MSEAGRTLLHYRLVERIGEGGMGVVWKAVDTTLGREVAIKVLPDALAADPERVARFQREAKALASLNHPNIATIHGFHEADGTQFLAMELVEGQDLAQRLAAGRLPLAEALRLAGQIADALQAAHDSGVVHRDLKPANVRLTADGTAKVLDLGLAKVFAPDPQSGGREGSLSLSPTLTSAGTVAGVLLGTAAYMSPEQARGQVADRRSDIWAFGCVLFEMLSGRRVFDGDTASDTLAGVLKSDPDWNALPADLPPAARRLLKRCLEKQPERRLHHIADARLEIREALESPAAPDSDAAEARPAAAPAGRLRWLPWALAAVLALVAAAALRQASVREARPASEPMTLAVPIPTGLDFFEEQFSSLALSRDGRHLALLLADDRGRRLYVRDLGELEPRVLEGTEDAANPFFSPDGQWIGFFADNRLKKVPVGGGTPVTLCAAVGVTRGATWADDDTIVFARHYTEALTRVPGSGGDPEPLTTLDSERNERTHRFPQAVPGSDVVLFTVQTTDSPEFYDDARIDAVHLASGERKTVYEGGSYARYVSSGHLVVGREGFLFAMPFDIERLEPTGKPVPVLENVLGARNSGVVHAEISETGLLAYVFGRPRARRLYLTWWNRDGTSERLAAPVDGYLSPALSPDGRRIAVGIGGETQFDIWTYDIERESRTRLTFEGDNGAPVWSPDGRQIVFSSVRVAGGNTYIKAADGSGPEELLLAATSLKGGGTVAPLDFFADGSRVLLNVADAQGPNIYSLTLGGSAEPEAFLETPNAEFGAKISPDERFIAYASDESGNPEVYVRPYPDAAGGRWQISVDGGTEPYWTRGGSEILYRQGTRLYSVEVDTRDGFRGGRPRLLHDRLPPCPSSARCYCPTADGERVLAAEPAERGTAPDRVTVVVNWLDDLTRRVPR